MTVDETGVDINHQSGHTCLVLCKAASLYNLRELKALLASTSNTASVLSAWKLSLMKWIAASVSAICPAQSWSESATSSLMA